MGGGGGARRRAAGADAAATGEWPRSKNASELRRAVAFFGHRNRGEVNERLL